MMFDLKDSRVEWIGNIPKHWEVSKFKYFFNFGMGETILKKNLSEEGVPVLSATEKYTILGYYKNPNLILDIGDLVIPARGISIGHVKIVKEKCVSTQTTIYGKKKASVNIMFVQFFCIGYRDNLFQFVQTAIPQITVEQVKSNPILLPPLEEQILIARYLNKKTEQIDSLTEKIHKKIELLKEQRTSLINRCVTKGITPNIEMKDSGVEWIGQIPKHWEIKKIKYLSSYNDETLDENTDPNYQFHYVEIGDVDYIKGVSIKNKISFNESPSRARRIVNPNDVIISTVRTYLRAIGVVPNMKNIVCSTGFCVLRGKPDKINQNFLSFSVRSEWFISDVIRNSYGVSYPAINSSELVELKIVTPPLKEQKLIAHHLTKKTEQLNTLIKKNQKKIELLKEYRQSLISSVVTGKIRITEGMV